MSDPAAMQALRMLKALGKIEDQKVREIIVRVAEAAAAGAEVNARLLGSFQRREPTENKPN